MAEHDFDWRRFVLEQPRTGKLATTRADGRPHVAPVWVDLDGDEVVFMTGETSVKGRSLRRDPRVAICFDDETPPFAFVLIEGTAQVSNDLGELRHWATRIGGRYMGSDRAEEFGARNGVPGELLVRVTSDKILARSDIGG
ncbi:MAG: PPOX class F420-dependent oxidoreductase [Egibacteraceae bacterium]